jgi:hypothetical protein
MYYALRDFNFIPPAGHDSGTLRNLIMPKYILLLIVTACTFFSCCKDEPCTTCPTDKPEEPTTLEGICVIEKDHLFGGFGGVDNYHETLVINTSVDTVCFTVESPLPIGLKHESLRSPAFGRDAIIPTPYQDYFDLPNINNSFYTNKPDSSTADCYFWRNLKLGHSDLMEVPYSNYYRDDGRIFIKEFGTSQFLYLDIVSDYSIEKDTIDSNYVDIEIKETLQNTTDDTLYRIGTHLFVPRELETQTDPYNPRYTVLYNLISDTIISDIRLYLFNNEWTNDGFGFFAGGQQVEGGGFILLPYQSCQFVFKMTIEPLLDKFEIYPSYGVTFITPNGDRIWPASIITVNDRRYNGQVHYLKECGFVLPTYILFSINHGTLKVVSPDDIVPTFKPNY